jgi:hypothetical protein
MIFFPIFFFLTEGVLFFSVLPYSELGLYGVIEAFWNIPDVTLPTYKSPQASILWILDLLGSVIAWFGEFIIWLIMLPLKSLMWFLGIMWSWVQVMFNILSVGFSMSIEFPILLVINIPLFLLLIAGIFKSITILGTGGTG